MYLLTLQSGGRITAADLTRELASLDCGELTGRRRMALMVAVEGLGARGLAYANQDFDVLSAALNFLDAVKPEHTLRGK